MALAKNVNSYVTVAEADVYFADRLDASAWVAANAITRAKALVTATSNLDLMSWAGTYKDETQPLAFPRIGYYFEPRAGTNVEFTSSVPSRIITATMELANYYLNNEGVTLNPLATATIKVGSIEITGSKVPSAIPTSVNRIIRPMLVNNGSSSWWRNN
jgi:hypothetical protein